jgi:hypothetical protein
MKTTLAWQEIFNTQSEVMFLKQMKELQISKKRKDGLDLSQARFDHASSDAEGRY